MAPPEKRSRLAFFPPDPIPGGYSVRDVARDLQVSPSTIRAWEERYQVPVPWRTVGGHRRYGLAERRQLLLMQEEIARGRRAVEAAAVAKADTWRKDLGARASLRRFIKAAQDRNRGDMVAELGRAERASGLETAIAWFAITALREVRVTFRLGLCEEAEVRRAIDVTQRWMLGATPPSQPTHGARLLAIVGSRSRCGVEG